MHGVDTEDLLGAAYATEAVRLLDLEVLGWLTNLLELGSTSVDFGRQDLCRSLYGRAAGGMELRAVDDSLRRLASARLSFGGYVAEWQQTVKPVAFQNVRLLEGVRPAGGRTGEALRAEFPTWMISQLEHGYATFVDWDATRQLQGLAKRLFLYISAQSKRVDPWGPGVSSTFLVLGARGLATLGLQDRDVDSAIQSLRRAATQLSDESRGLDLKIERKRGQLRLQIKIWETEPRAFASQSSRVPKSRNGPPLIGSKSPALHARSPVQIPHTASFVQTGLFDDSEYDEYLRVPYSFDWKSVTWPINAQRTFVSGDLCLLPDWSLESLGQVFEFVALCTPFEIGVHRASCRIVLETPVGPGGLGSYAASASVGGVWEWMADAGHVDPDPCELCAVTNLG